MTKIICLIFINLVTPNVGAKRELLFNEPATGVNFIKYICIISIPARSCAWVVLLAKLNFDGKDLLLIIRVGFLYVSPF